MKWTAHGCGCNKKIEAINAMNNLGLWWEWNKEIWGTVHTKLNKWSGMLESKGLPFDWGSMIINEEGGIRLMDSSRL